MMFTRLLDSVILIDHFNDIPEGNQFILSLDPATTAISVITRAEILVGIESQDQPLVRALLDQFHLLIIDKSIADLTASLRRDHNWKLPDAFQAALCIYHKIKLATRNTKDFDPQKYDFVEVPYTI
jgi:predicted nucleic acid-binding protein